MKHIPVTCTNTWTCFMSGEKKKLRGLWGAGAVGLTGRDEELNRQRDHEWEPGREIEKRIRNR